MAPLRDISSMHPARTSKPANDEAKSPGPLKQQFGVTKRRYDGQVNVIGWFARNARFRVASTALCAGAPQPKAADPRHPRLLDRPTRRHSRPADQAANGDTSHRVPQSPSATPRVLGSSWQTVPYHTVSPSSAGRQVQRAAGHVYALGHPPAHSQCMTVTPKRSRPHSRLWCRLGRLQQWDRRGWLPPDRRRWTLPCSAPRSSLSHPSVVKNGGDVPGELVGHLLPHSMNFVDCGIALIRLVYHRPPFARACRLSESEFAGL